ncbi:MAG TPA: tRNA uridine-5-carboxymethylaminomethyl(34) synthesis GTPase MnmE [Pseudomonadales bacterium]|nr:tRNA uridine-5-carboxymethylaminomethyl(34) synthesis GTPase MnmE [Pseudomonadales bacterium]
MTAAGGDVLDRDTIAAIATAPGKGGVGIIRLSGKEALGIGEAISKKKLPVRHAVFSSFSDDNGIIDQGIALYFAAPASFTGEDVVELHGHGGPQVLNMLLATCVQHGARLARPGEFSERAYLNDKLDLAQAEAIADLIDAGSAQAARNAVHSLQGQFSAAINVLVEKLVQLRIYVEAAIDFPDEEIDFLADGNVAAQLAVLSLELDDILRQARQGALIREGLQVVIAGKPNAGKSSLLNALAGRDAAIVTDIAGTTRDVLREYIDVDGLPLHIIDTAGLRDSEDPVEQEGIRRAWAEIEKADLVLLLVDSSTSAETDPDRLWQDISHHRRPTVKTLIVRNKIDVSLLHQDTTADLVCVSAKTGAGLAALKAALKEKAGLQSAGEGLFSARSRHVDALMRTHSLLQDAAVRFGSSGAGELLAEDLKLAQRFLGEITGQFSSDELLGRIFSGFCIGK